MKKTILVLSLILSFNHAFAQSNTNSPVNNNSTSENSSIFNSQALTDYLTSVSSSQLKSALGLDFETQAYTKILDGLFAIWKSTFNESNTDIGQVVVKLYDNMKNVLQGISFDIKTEKAGEGLVIKSWINYPFKQEFKTFNVDYYVRKEGNFWKVYDVKIGGLDVLPLYKIINKPN